MEKKKKRLLIIDGHAVLHRAYHALPPLTTKKGELINAVYGFLLVFLRALRELRPDYIVATFDSPGPTFRHEKYKAYKATRPPTPKELYQQISKTKDTLRAFGVPIFEKEGYEADDLIGTISKVAPQKQILPELETIIISGDFDILQLVDSHTKVYLFRRGVKDAVVYDTAAVKAKYQGLTPDQLPDLKALQGDVSDNIPGVPGIGEKGAIELIKKFGSLENLYSELRSEKGKSLIKPSLQSKLKEYKEQAFFSKILAQIKKDVPIDFHLEKCSSKEYNKEKVTKVFQNLEFYSLVQRLPSRLP